MTQTIEHCGHIYPARPLKWREMKQIRQQVETSTELLFGLMGFTDADHAAVDELFVAEVNELQILLFKAATGNGPSEKN